VLLWVSAIAEQKPITAVEGSGLEERVSTAVVDMTSGWPWPSTLGPDAALRAAKKASEDTVRASETLAEALDLAKHEARTPTPLHPLPADGTVFRRSNGACTRPRWSDRTRRCGGGE
jgi:hypothetical protein